MLIDQQHDSFYPYLLALDTQLAEYLSRTIVTSLIPLRSNEDAAMVMAPSKPRALPSFFFTVILEDTAELSHSYSDFSSLFQRFDGRLLLLGEPGAGKTTTLMAYARHAVTKRLEDPNQPLPLVMPIATWDVDETPSILEWLESQIPMLDRSDLAREYYAGRTLLLLDGLDELGVERKNKITQELFDPRLVFIEQIPGNNQVLITCRIKEYTEIGQKIHLNGAAILEPLNDEQRRIYLASSPKLLAAIEEDDGLYELTRTPLMLSLFASAFNNMDKKLRDLRNLNYGELRDKIISTYIQQCYKREKRRRKLNITFSLEKLYDILGKIAMYDAGSYNNENIFSPEIFKRYLAEGDVNLFVDFACLLNIMSWDNNYLRFSHLLVRDHFAFLQAQLGMSDREGSIRDSAAWALWQIPDDRATTILLRALTDPYKYARGSAAAALGRIGNPIAIESLTKLLADDTAVYSMYGNRICDVAAAAIKMIEDYQQSQAIRIVKQRRLQVLERQAAFFGQHCPSHIILEIEDLYEELKTP